MFLLLLKMVLVSTHYSKSRLFLSILHFYSHHHSQNSQGPLVLHFHRGLALLVFNLTVKDMNYKASSKSTTSLCKYPSLSSAHPNYPNSMRGRTWHVARGKLTAIISRSGFSPSFSLQFLYLSIILTPTAVFKFKSLRTQHWQQLSPVLRSLKVYLQVFEEIFFFASSYFLLFFYPIVALSLLLYFIRC